MNQTKSQLYSTATSTLLLKTICAFWLIAKLVTWRIWTTHRLYPTAPVFNFFDMVPGYVQSSLFILSLLLILSALLFKHTKVVLGLLLIVEISSCLFDQTRWQPWEYQCLFIIIAYVINIRQPKLFVIAFCFILASTYFYSGLNKLNEGFLNNIWTKDILKSFLKISASIARRPFVHYSGYLAAVVEALCGLGLLFPKTQKTAARLLIAMHVFILALLGPAGLNYNMAVWPWNIAMSIYLYLIFLKNDDALSVFKLMFVGWNKTIFLFWAVLPVLTFWGYWDAFLSSSIYSGKAPAVLVYIKDTTQCPALQKFYKPTLRKNDTAEAVININNWVLAETNVIPNPELRVYKIIQRKLQQQYGKAGLHYEMFIKGRRYKKL